MKKFSFRRNFLRLWRDKSGVSAIEFALVMPVMITMLLFSASLNDSVNTTTEIGKVTAAVADILSQSPTITKQTIDANFKAANLLVGPTRVGTLEMFVVGVEVKSNKRATVLWSRDNGNLKTLRKPAPGDDYDLPPEVLERAGFIVSSRARMTHENIIHRVGLGSKTNTGVYNYESNFVPRASIDTSCSNCSN